MDEFNNVVRYFLKKKMCVYTEIGLRPKKESAIRADIVALSMTKEIVIVEWKNSILDFERDKKYWLYLDYCDKLYIAARKEVITKISVDSRVGLINASGKCRILKRPKKQELSFDDRINLITRLAFRNADFNRYGKWPSKN